MDLSTRSLAALDWPVLLDRLSRHARTHRGREAALRLGLVGTAVAARLLYDAVAEVWALDEAGHAIPVGAVLDVETPLRRAARGLGLDSVELRDVGSSLVALDTLRKWVDERADLAPRIRDLAQPIQVDAELKETLAESFDATGELSAERYPELGDYREKIRNLKERIRAVLEDMVKGDALGDALQDRFVTDRGGRFVVPVKAGFRRGLGIVHGTSQSGETVYVEPAEVVERTNEMKEAEAALAREERRIFTMLSRLVGHHAPTVLPALEAAVEIDLAVARAGLGTELRAVIPKVGEGGVVLLREARHPVLQLRGVAVVANDLGIDSKRLGLILTGPNTGGKTVALKTIGLATLMVRAGLPVPAAEGSRVDLFDQVLADVGDTQTVEGDLSTFSGHLLVLRQMLERASPTSLILLDEIGMGTDPAQGAALARAVIEGLVDRGARVVVTTHFAQLKGLAAADERFAVAAVQYADGRPTYRLEAGFAGQSHAFAIARRMLLPEAVVDRARDVLGAGERELADLMEQLDDERALLRAQQQALIDRQRRLEDQVREARVQTEKLEERRRKLETEVAAGFERRMKEKEAIVRGLISALQENPNLKLAGRSLDKIRDLRGEVAETMAPVVLPPPPPPAGIAVGDIVMVRTFGKKGRVSAVLSGDRFEVEIGTLKMKVGRADLGEGPPRPPAPPPLAPPPPDPRGAEKMVAKVRTSTNTADLRGLRVEEAIDTITTFLDAQISHGEGLAFLLHGHGTGALKTAVREHLPRCRYVKKWRAAEPSEGGDAYTLVELG